MADIVAQGDGLQQVFVQPQKLADGAGDLGKELHVQHPVADVFMVDEIEDLGLVDITGVGPGVEDAIGIYRELLAVAPGHGLFKTAAAGLDRAGGVRRQPGFLLPLQDLA